MRKISIIIVLLLFASCRTVNMSDLNPKVKNNKLLPTLEIRIDGKSFESAYTLGQINSTSNSYGTSIGTGLTNGFIGLNMGTTETSQVMSRDPRIQDDITIFDRDVKYNITNPYGEKKGIILCRINASNHRKGNGWGVLSAFTLWIPNLLGMPNSAPKTTLDVEVEVYNKSNDLVGKYSAVACSRKYRALYWGYDKENAKRVANIYAFKKAMNDIKKQIYSDYENIIKKLK